MSPSQYIVTRPAYSKAKTPEAAIAKAKEVMAQREEERKQAAVLSSEASLPALKGTTRQIEWANTIRAKALKKNPDLPALKKATTASYWIDRRFEFA